MHPMSNNTFGLLVGVERYAMAGQDLIGPADQVFKIADHMIASGLAPPGNISLFANASSRRSGELQSRFSSGLARLQTSGVQFLGAPESEPLDRFCRAALPSNRPVGSRLFVFWAGHGLTHATGRRICFCSDYEPRLRTRVFDTRRFLDFIHREPFEQQLHFFDICANYDSRFPIELTQEVQPDRHAVDQSVFFSAREGDYAANDASAASFSATVLDTMSRQDPWSGGFASALVLALQSVGKRIFHVSYQYREQAGEIRPDANTGEVAVPTGALAADDPTYVSRPIDRTILELVRQGSGKTIVLRAPRQYGKSSLLMRMIQIAKDQGRNVVCLDASGDFDTEALRTPGIFYQRFADAIASALNFSHNATLTLPRDLTGWMERETLRRYPKPLTLVIEETDKLLASPFRYSIFAMWRRWENSRANHPEVWSKLDLYLSFSQNWQAIDDLQDIGSIGLTYELPPLGLADVRLLAKIYSSAFPEEVLPEVLRMTGGHPYLSRLNLAALLSGPGQNWETFTPMHDHLLGVLRRIFSRPAWKTAMLDAIQGRGCRDPLIEMELVAEGLLRREAGTVVPSCQMYHEYFLHKLV
jgi:hypothetical protein